MKNTRTLITALVVLLTLIGMIKSVYAETLGFDILGSFYSPSDSRYQGIGSGIALNIKLNDDVTMGYRTEELNVKAEDTVAGVQVADNHTVTLQGIFAYYDVTTVWKCNVNLGLWMGQATASDFNAAGTTGMTAILLEPNARLRISSSDKGKTQAYGVVGIGYRFIRRFSLNTPFGGTSNRLNNLDGLDINFGVGLAF